jgi:hypothetical protein
MYNQNKCKLQKEPFCCIVWQHKCICNEIAVYVQTNNEARQRTCGGVQAHVWSLDRPFCMAAGSALPPDIQIRH